MRNTTLGASEFEIRRLYLVRSSKIFEYPQIRLHVEFDSEEHRAEQSPVEEAATELRLLTSHRRDSGE